MWLITVKPSYVFGFRILYNTVRMYYNSLEDQKPLKGNIVGSRLSNDLAYIAGFLDETAVLCCKLKSAQTHHVATASQQQSASIKILAMMQTSIGYKKL